MRLIPVMLALLLALSPGAVALQASAPVAAAPAHGVPSLSFATTDSVVAQTETDTVRPAPNGNTTAVLTLGTESARSGFETPSLSLGSALAQERGHVQMELSVATLDQQLQAADSVEQRKQILNRYRYRIENRIISLKARERQATEAFSNETMSKSEYLRTLGEIDAEAAEIRKLSDAMRKRAESVPRFSMKTEAHTLKGKLESLEGPIRTQIRTATRGRSSPTKVYVATADTGVVLSTIVGDSFVREITRADRRNPSSSNQIGIRKAQQRIENQYSWSSNNSPYRAIDGYYGTTNVYRMQFQHTQGQLLVYYDAGTEKIFKEVQYKRLVGENSLPPGPGVANSSDNLTLVVNRTYPGGPLRVNLTNETGVPRQGEIRVSGEPVGRTHADGSLWTLGPPEQFEVSATYRGRTVNVTVTPVDSS